MDKNSTVEMCLESIFSSIQFDSTNQMLNKFRQHVEDIVKDSSKCKNELEKELAAALKDYHMAVNCNCFDCMKEKLKSAQEHLDKISEMIDFYNLYIDLIKGLQSEIESKRNSISKRNSSDE